MTQTHEYVNIFTILSKFFCVFRNLINKKQSERFSNEFYYLFHIAEKIKITIKIIQN